MNYNYFLLCVCLFLNLSASAQILLPDGTPPSGITNASEGDYYLAKSILYVGTSNGLLKQITTAAGSTDGEVLSWNTATNTWLPQIPVPTVLTLEKSTIRTVNRARVALQPESNINDTGTFTVRPNATFELNETAATISNTDITNLVGNIRFVLQPYLLSSAARTNFICNFIVNGTLTKRQAGSLYARNNEGHDETGSSFIFEYEGATAGNTFSFSFIREASEGTVELISDATSSSYIFIEQYTSLEVITNVTAPINSAITQGPIGITGATGLAGIQGIQGIQGTTGINDPLDVYHATGNIKADGTNNYIQGATVTKNSVGAYTITFNSQHSAGVLYPVLLSMSQNDGLDDYVPAYTILSDKSFRVQITEQDNGTGAGVLEDAAFSFYIPL
jgi:hypothetical protein